MRPAEGHPLAGAPMLSYLEAEVRCYHCGELTGVARVGRAPTQTEPVFVAAGSGREMPLRWLAAVRCRRCGGPSYAEAFETRRTFPIVDCLGEQPRRGRPRNRPG